MWDQRYNTPEFVYGEEPNSFLVENTQYLMPGSLLCLAEGEGRNGVFLARKGFQVIAVDSSMVGLQKARALAARHKVELRTVVADLAEYVIDPESVDNVVSIFCHLPPEVRKRIHGAVVNGLKPGGVLILEAYTPDQLLLKTGGPPAKEMMMTLGELRSELAGLDFVFAQEIEREVVEGRLHTGVGAVVQVIAKKP
ncbi:class I SAM-dependent methyltransferase [Desulfopila aestuarii]|uniref:Methyltransferase domain-containing protein n=1 Tax=Desulfopila aestuarii DSM 18488 TaxID=1121416 RepID=A0A1M7Y8C2_9BACT|nr:class I SAM-dependent methyltransferase [Desulfopila aestuarii]SHO48821.1 Methyltransferase domain-containing protein [Desulfopila aestuarii DSM 18488]